MIWRAGEGNWWGCWCLMDGSTGWLRKVLMSGEPEVEGGKMSTLDAV